jgi:hypothetical protein
MRKLLIGGLAALTFGLTALPAPEAVARDRHYYRHRDRGDDALVAGIAGLAIGAALASGGRRDYYDDGYRYRRYYNDRRYYGRPHGYYGPRSYYGAPRYYSYGRGYDRCRTVTQWDPWSDAYVRRSTCW